MGHRAGLREGRRPQLAHLQNGDNASIPGHVTEGGQQDDVNMVPGVQPGTQ